MTYTITLIPGDGIGPEVVMAAQTCLRALQLDIVWEEALAGQSAVDKGQDLLPAATLASIRKNKVALKGPITTPIGGGFRSVNVTLRQEFDLYAGLRPARSWPGGKGVYPDIDLLVVRENSEDLYLGVEFPAGQKNTRDLIARLQELSNVNIQPDSALSIKPISYPASARISRFAFELAKKQGRKKVTAVHKANIMKETDGLFLRAFRETAASFPAIAAEDILVDNLAMQLVLRPQQFEVLVLPNLYGDIISDLCAGLTGGLGLAPGANLGQDIAIFEPVHGSAPKHAGLDKANPAAMILTVALMLEYLDEKNKAEILRQAVSEVIAEGKRVTYDLKASKNDPTAVGTKAMTAAIVEKINKLI